MGTMARRVTGLVVALAVWAPAGALAGERTANPAAPGAPRAIITGGYDQKATWLGAQYRELQLRTRTERATLAVAIDIHAGTDLVNIVISPKSLTISRAGRQIVVDSPAALEQVQQLLGGSTAVFAVKAMLSDLEPVSDLKAPEFALLSTAAFVASIVGDVGAPLRIADRFVAKHRGIYRQVRENGGCWSEYTKETTAAWDELQGCMADANEKDFFRAAYERLACNAVWLLRAESAWFEYLKCLAPLGSLPQ